MSVVTSCSVRLVPLLMELLILLTMKMIYVHLTMILREPVCTRFLSFGVRLLFVRDSGSTKVHKCRFMELV